MAEKRRVVGLLVMTEMPDGILYAVLQRRGEFNHEKMGPESFPGGCQLTVWGGIEGSESPMDAILREANEEVGECVADYILDSSGSFVLDDILKTTLGDDAEEFKKDIELDKQLEEGKKNLEVLAEIYRFEDDENLKVVYGIKMHADMLKTVRLGPQSGGLRLLKEEEIPLVQDLKSFDRNIGVIDRRVIAMFSDTKEAIQNAFKLFSR